MNTSRSLTLIGAIGSALGVVGLAMKNVDGIPSWLPITAVLVGLLLTSTNERIQGGVSDPIKRAEADRVER